MRARLTDNELDALYYSLQQLLRSTVGNEISALIGALNSEIRQIKKKTLRRALVKLENQLRQRRLAAIFKVGVLAAKASPIIPMFKGLHDREPQMLGSIEQATFYAGVKSILPDYLP